MTDALASRPPAPAAAGVPGPAALPADPVPAPAPPRPKFGSSVRARILSGLLAILPLLLTLLIVSYIVNFVNWLMGPLSRWVADHWLAMPRFIQDYPWLITYPLSFLLAGVLLYAVGVLASTRLRQAFNDLILRVPFIKKLYSSIERVVSTLAGSSHSQRGMFERVCFFQLVNGVEQVGFLTGQTSDPSTGRTLLCIYVPTPPNPTSGLIYMVPPERVRMVGWSAEQSVQTIVSGGMLIPTQVTFRPVDFRTDFAQPTELPSGPQQP